MMLACFVWLLPKWLDGVAASDGRQSCLLLLLKALVELHKAGSQRLSRVLLGYAMDEHPALVHRFAVLMAAQSHVRLCQASLSHPQMLAQPPHEPGPHAMASEGGCLDKHQLPPSHSQRQAWVFCLYEAGTRGCRALQAAPFQGKVLSSEPVVGPVRGLRQVSGQFVGLKLSCKATKWSLTASALLQR